MIENVRFYLRFSPQDVGDENFKVRCTLRHGRFLSLANFTVEENKTKQKQKTKQNNKTPTTKQNNKQAKHIFYQCV